NAVYPAERLLDAARVFSRELHAFDALALAREHRTEVNAILLGALAGSGALPLASDAYRGAIRTKGVQVDANLRGFELGLALAEKSGNPIATRETIDGHGPSRRDTFDEPRVTALPERLRPIVRQALPRLIDYQDAG